MSKKKKNKNGDTREFTALKQSDCRNVHAERTDNKQAENMRLTDREQRPGVEV